MLEVNIDRIRDNIETICEFNATPGQGYTRFSYSKEDMQAREFLINECQKFGLKVTTDGVGNIRAKLEGLDPQAPSVMSGSHIDTVYHGGKYDGLVGTIGALEAIRTIIENGIKTLNSLEFVVFSEEEGSNFGSTLAGSKAMVGYYSVDDLKKLKNPHGISMYDMAKRAGYDPDKVTHQVLKHGEAKAMLELHIEQSVVLESKNIPIGIVEAIAGMQAYEIVLKGVANHAGATPMSLRNDPMATAAKIMAHIEDLAKTTPSGSTVATVGRIFCEPNISNVIPEKVLFTLDARDVDNHILNQFVSDVRQKLIDESALHGVSSNMHFLGTSDAISLDKLTVELLENEAKARNIPFMRMNSGAVHDSSILSTVTKVGMIFIPSVNGRSHVPEEDSRYEDIDLGCNILLGSLLKLAM